MRTSRAMTGRISGVGGCIPHMPPSPRTPPSPHTPPGTTMHAPLGATTHTPLGATTHAPPSNHAHPPSNHACPPVNRITDRCKNNLRKLRLRAVTRMHSSRMRTGRSLTVCWSLLSGGGGCLLPGGGVYPSMHWSRHPPVNRITDACKNVTLAQLRCGR